MLKHDCKVKAQFQVVEKKFDSVILKEFRDYTTM